LNERPIDPEIRAGAPEASDDAPGVSPDLFREALARWASGVTVLATRDPDDGRIYAVTVSSFASVSARPPRILASLGPGAQPLPFLDEGREFVVNVLSDRQQGLARRFTDPFPVGPSPFPEEGAPTIEDAHVRIRCEVERVFPLGSSRLVVGLVVHAEMDDGASPLLHYRRAYRVLGEGEPPPG
jgi:flavin reductase (DIM6/NTAB) family NADH-FMN oxidoreductase RutF